MSDVRIVVGAGALDAAGGVREESAFGTAPDATTVFSERDKVMADIEARLAEECRKFCAAAFDAARKTAAIREEIPEGADFAKLMVGMLPLYFFHFGEAFSHCVDEGILVDDGASYLKKVGLRLGDLSHQIILDGRQFYLVPAIDKPLGNGNQ